MLYNYKFIKARLSLNTQMMMIMMMMIRVHALSCPSLFFLNFHVACQCRCVRVHATWVTDPFAATENHEFAATKNDPFSSTPLMEKRQEALVKE